MTRFLRLLVVFGALTLTSVSAQQPAPARLTAVVRQLPASSFVKLTAGVRGMALSVSSKLDPRLRDVIDAARGGTDVRSRSLELGARGATLRIPVTAHAADGAHTAALTDELRGLDAEIWSTFDTTIWAALPPAGVDRLAASPNLHYLTVQDAVAPTQVGSVAAALDSIRATRVRALHDGGIRGRGVKIGIIDFGFTGYRRLQAAGVVPAPTVTAAFPSAQTFEGNTEHGTACAEIVHAMAPEADLYLASAAGNEGAMMAAARWMIQQDVDIISLSGGGVTGASDGQGAMDRLVDETTQRNNVLWVISAGNEGDKHWRGPSTDADHDKFVDDGLIPFTAGRDDVTVTVRWNDWGPDSRRPRSTEDIDAFLLEIGDDGKPAVVAKSTEDQNGSGPPIERLRLARKGLAGQSLAVVLRNARTTRLLDIHVFVDGARLDAPVPDGSIASPASASYAVAVGAWDVSTTAMAAYSSRGPTDDNRLKPEIGAPAGMASVAMGHVFHGTSAACPHVAGFAALIKQATPSLEGLSLRTALLKAVEPKGTPVPNMASGYGWIDGALLPPLPLPPGSPTTGSPVSGSPPAPPLSSPPAPPRPAAAGARVTLPIAWGGAVSAGFLDRVTMPPDQPREFLTRVITGRDLYRVGDGLKVGFRSSERCDYLLLHRSSEGRYTLLSPRDGMRGSLEAGAPLLLPAETETFEVAPPLGVEELLLLCARHAIDLSRTDAGAAIPAGLIVARHRYQVSQ